MNAPLLNPAINQIADPLDTAVRLLELLEQEAAALQAADAARIMETSRAKAGLLAQLAGHALPAAGDQRRTRLRELILQCQVRSRANETLLNARAARVRNLLRSLQGMPAGYDVHGEGRYALSAASGTLRGSA